jgi:hypothetical protein
MQFKSKQFVYILLVVLATAAWRVFNAQMAWYHVVPMAALGLFTGSVMPNARWAYFVPLAGMFLSDIGLSVFTQTPGFYGVSQLINYAALAAVVVLGRGLQQRNAVQIGAYSISGTLLFFIISNFSTFVSGYYGFSFAGLRECYIMAIPFYKSEMATSFFVNSLQADLLFSFMAFGLYQLLIKTRQLATH